MSEIERLSTGRFRYRWKDLSGRRVSKVFFSTEEAELFRRRKELELTEIRLGLREAPPPEITLEDLASKWIEVKSLEKKSIEHDKSILRAHLVPVLGNLAIKQIGPAALDRLRADRSALSPKTFANIATLLISLLRFAHSRGLVDKLPPLKKPKFFGQGTDFRYLKSQHEISRFLSAARDLDEYAFILYATAIFTGMRAGELLGLKWENVDLCARQIHVKASFSGSTKSGRTRVVPILDPLLPILREWKLRNPLPLVFPNRAGNMHQPSPRVIQEKLSRVLDLAGFPKAKRSGRPSNYITFHDLRHTFASQWVASGGCIYRLKDILGHSSIAMTMRYAHLNPDRFSEDWGRLGSELTKFNIQGVLPLFSGNTESDPELRNGREVAAHGTHNKFRR